MENKQEEIIKNNENSDVVTPAELTEEALDKIFGGTLTSDARQWVYAHADKLSSQQYLGREKLEEVLVWCESHPAMIGRDVLYSKLIEAGFNPGKVH